MAAPDEPIPFTVGDQERLKRLEVKMDAVCHSVACVTNIEPTPEILDARLQSLEATRKKWYTALGSLTVMGLIAIISAAVAHWFGGK